MIFETSVENTCENRSLTCQSGLLNIFDMEVLKKAHIFYGNAKWNSLIFSLFKQFLFYTGL